jgi:hypothetical protein
MRNKVMWIVILVVLGIIVVVMYAPKMFDGDDGSGSGSRTVRGDPTKSGSDTAKVRLGPGEVVKSDGTIAKIDIPEGENSIKYTSGDRENRLEHLQTNNTVEEVVAAFETLRESDDPEEKEVAMLVISRDKEKSNKEFFIEMMRDTSQPEGVRANAATGLANIGALDAVPYLLEAMADPDCPTLRARASSGLVRLTGRDYGFDATAPASYREDMLAKIIRDTPTDRRYPSD